MYICILYINICVFVDILPLALCCKHDFKAACAINDKEHNATNKKIIIYLSFICKITLNNNIFTRKFNSVLQDPNCNRFTHFEIAQFDRQKSR